MSLLNWGLCCTIKALQAVTLLDYKQLKDISIANKPLFPAVASTMPSPMIPVPRDHSTMDFDVHVTGTQSIKSPTPSIVSCGFYRELCHQRNLFWQCLNTYNDAHQDLPRFSSIFTDSGCAHNASTQIDGWFSAPTGLIFTPFGLALWNTDVSPHPSPSRSSSGFLSSLLCLPPYPVSASFSICGCHTVNPSA